MLLSLVPFVVLGLCAAPWVLALRPRIGTTLAAGGVLVTALLLLMAALFASSALQLDPLLSAMTVIVLGGAAGVVALWRTPGARVALPGLAHRWLPSSLGGIVWIGVVLAAPLIPGAAPLSWAMNGDTANNLHIGRYFLDNNGLTPRFSVPLGHALQILGMTPGRVEGDKQQLLEHDLVAFVAVWTLELAFTALLFGLVVSSLLQPHRRLTIAATSALGSLLGTTWYVAGLPIEFGYFNMHLAVPLLLFSWLVFLESRRLPFVATGVQLGLGVLLLTTWTPLIVFTIGFVAATMTRHRAELRRLHGRSVASVLAAFMVFLVPLLFFAVPALADGVSSLSSPGHGMPFTGWLIPLLLGPIFAGTVLLRHSRELPVLDAAAVLTASTAVSIGVLLFISQYEADPWATYYPAKLTWLITASLVPIALSFIVRVISDSVPVRSIATVAAALIVAASLVVASSGPPTTHKDFAIVAPLERVVLGTVWHSGEHTVERIMSYTDDSRRDILWQSGDPDEGRINFWILEFNGGDTQGDPLIRQQSLIGHRTLRDTGSYYPDDITALCTLVERLEAPVFVHTANPALRAELADSCPGAEATVIVEPAPTRE